MKPSAPINAFSKRASLNYFIDYYFKLFNFKIIQFYYKIRSLNIKKLNYVTMGLKH